MSDSGWGDFTGLDRNREEAERAVDRENRAGGAEDAGRDVPALLAGLEHDYPGEDAQALQREINEANARSLAYKAADDRLNAETYERNKQLQRAEDEAARDRAERADPDTAPLVDNRDKDAAAGRFDDADSWQRLIDSMRQPGPPIHERQGRTRDEDVAERIECWHQTQGRTQDRGHVFADRWDRNATYSPMTRGRGEQR